MSPKVLTADGSGALEGSSDIRVHSDQHVLLLGDLGVPGLDLVLDPAHEDFAKHGGADVHDPLLGRLVDLDLVWQEGVDVRMLHQELIRHVREREALVVRHADRSHVLGLHVC